MEGQVGYQNLGLNSVDVRDNLEENEVGFEGNKRRNMGLREIRKKSWRVSSVSTQHGSVCEQCGKGFKSDKALFGHMRLHSTRKTVGMKKGMMKMTNPIKKKRSQRRYKMNNYSNNSSTSKFNPAVSSSSASCHSVDEELEDIALCLLMLGNGGFVSFREEVTEFSGLQTFDGGVSNTSQGNPSVDCTTKLVSGCETENFGDLHGAELKDELNDFLIVDCTKKLVFEIESEDQGADETSDSRVGDILLKKYQHQMKHICKICNRSFKSGQSLGGHKLHCPFPRRYHRSNNARTEAEILIPDEKTEDTTSELKVEKEGHVESNKRGKRHKCPICGKSFCSGQALGGHMRAHFHDKLECNEKEFVSDPEIAVAVCGSKQQTLDQFPSKVSEPVLVAVGVVAAV